MGHFIFSMDHQIRFGFFSIKSPKNVWTKFANFCQICSVLSDQKNNLRNTSLAITTQSNLHFYLLAMSILLLARFVFEPMCGLTSTQSLHDFAYSARCPCTMRSKLCFNHSATSIFSPTPFVLWLRLPRYLLLSRIRTYVNS